MRTILSLLLFSLIPIAAEAQPLPVPPDPAARCADLAEVPLDALTQTPVIAARLSMASCGAEARLRGVTITDDAAGVALVQVALEPSLATIDDVAKSDDPRWQILAAHARADLLFGTVTRMRASIPPISAVAKGDELIREDADRAARRAALEPMLAPWIADATADCRRVVQLARQYPQATDDLVIAAAVRHAQQDLTAEGF